MSLKLDKDYNETLKSAKPQHFAKKVQRAMSGKKTFVEPEIDLPALNTDIQFQTTLPKFNMSKNMRALRAAKDIPVEFDWRFLYESDSEEIKKKKKLISAPGNQMLCGSCWAISGAEIIGDNFVVKGLVDWLPSLSTTYILSCYPQSQCRGGNPARLFKDVATKGGVASDHCVDYSWCATNEACSGSATKHFDAQKVDLNKLIPKCGCYDGNSKHYIYTISKNIQTVSVGVQGVTEDTIKPVVRQHIYNNGPVCGGFIVFKNFMRGTFSKVNGGVYLERAAIDPEGKITFSDKNASASEYSGSHAVAIIGWGVQKNIIIDQDKDGKYVYGDVPYWYCRNSWTEKWADGGYFKMACYPFNKLAQFDKIVQLDTPKGTVQAGGIILLTATEPPALKSIRQIPGAEKMKKLKDASYYSSEETKVKEEAEKIIQEKIIPLRSENGEEEEGKGKVHSNQRRNKIIVIVVLAILVFLIARNVMKKK